MLSLRIYFAIEIIMIPQIAKRQGCSLQLLVFMLLQIQPKLGITLFHSGLKQQTYLNIEKIF